MILDLLPSLVLVDEDFSVYVTTQLEDLNQCVSSYVNLYHCAASLSAK